MNDYPLIDSNLCQIVCVNVKKIKNVDKLKFRLDDEQLKISLITKILHTDEVVKYAIVSEGDVDALYRAVKDQVDDSYGFHTAYANRYNLNRTIDEIGTLLGLHVRRKSMIFVQIERYGTMPDRWFKRLRQPKAYEAPIACAEGAVGAGKLSVYS